MNKEVKNTEKLYHQLMSQEEIAFPLPRKRMKASTDRGVYIIFDPHCTVVHVGRTPRAKNGIRQRLYDHLGGRSSFTQNYLTSPRVIFTRENSGFVDSLEDLSNKTISVERGYFLQQKLSDEYPNIKLLIKETTEDALESLSMGEADAYVGNLMAGTYIIKMKGLNNIKVAAPAPFGNLTLAMGVRKDWPELASIINKVIETGVLQPKWATSERDYTIDDYL